MNLEGSGNTRWSCLLDTVQGIFLDGRLQDVAEAPINEFTARMLDALNGAEAKAVLYNGIEAGLIPEEFMLPVIEHAMERLQKEEFEQQMDDLFSLLPNWEYELLPVVSDPSDTF